MRCGRNMETKFWDNKTAELCREYCLNGQKIETMFELAKEDSSGNIYKYLKNFFDGIAGFQQVYLVRFDNESTTGLFKVGYTKHKNLQTRFGESRWGEKLIIGEIIRQVELPANGSVEFEKYIKTTVLPNASLNGTNPGKGEFYDDSKLEEVLNVWDKSVHKYKEIWGIKAPN